jgi:hypothetical protein
VSGRSLGAQAAVREPAKLDRRELLWLVAMIFAILLFVQAPYALAFLTARADYAFSGTLLYLDDSNSYLAKIGQGTAGNWLFYNLYTPEPHQPGPLYPLYIVWGQIGAVLGTPPTATMAIARLVHGLVLLVTLYWFLTLLLPQRKQRQTAFLLLAFSSGLGWLLLPFGEATVLGDLAPDFWMPEVSTFLTVFIFPHFAAATTLMLLTFGGLLLAFRHGRMTPALGAALAAFLLAWIHPFLLVPVYGVAAAYLAWQGIRHRGIPWRSAGYLTLGAVTSLPVMAYLQFGVIEPSAVFQGWMDQNAAPSPNVLAYLTGFGLLVPLAAVGTVRSIQRREHLHRFPLFWVGVGSLLLYAPFAVQRRFAEGLQIPLAVLAALGWQHFRHLAARRPLRRTFLTAILVAGLVTSTLLNWISAVSNVLSRDFSVFISQNAVEAMTWLGEHSNWRDTVLASYPSGSYIPVWAGNRVVIGHWAETIHLDGKDRDVRRFFDGSASPQARSAIVRRYQVRYLFYGPYERRLGDYDPASDPSWDPVFANEDFTIYRSALVP